MELHVQIVKVDASSTQLSVATHLDVRGIRFRKVDGKNCNHLVLATALFDADGRPVDGEMNEIALKLEDSALEKINSTGLVFTSLFTVKPGSYRVRSVVLGSEGDPLTAQNLMTVIPGTQKKP